MNGVNEKEGIEVVIRSKRNKWEITVIDAPEYNWFWPSVKAFAFMLFNFLKKHGIFSNTKIRGPYRKYNTGKEHAAIYLEDL
jgi:hypothetical protein